MERIGHRGRNRSPYQRAFMHIPDDTSSNSSQDTAVAKTPSSRGGKRRNGPRSHSRNYRHGRNRSSSRSNYTFNKFSERGCGRRNRSGSRNKSRVNSNQYSRTSSASDGASDFEDNTSTTYVSTRNIQYLTGSAGICEGRQNLNARGNGSQRIPRSRGRGAYRNCYNNSQIKQKVCDFDAVNKKEVFDTLVGIFKGRAKLIDIERECVENFLDFSSKEVFNWFSEYEPVKDWFRAFERTPVEESIIAVCKRPLKLCFSYTTKMSCKNTNCSYIHICLDFLANMCARRACHYSHDVFDIQNSKVLANLYLDGYSSEEILNILHTTNMKTCTLYNSANGCPCLPSQTCPDLHICQDYIRGKCLNNDNCTYEHDIFSSQCMDTLRIYKMDHLKPSIIKKSIWVLGSGRLKRNNQVELHSEWLKPKINRASRQKILGDERDVSESTGMLHQPGNNIEFETNQSKKPMDWDKIHYADSKYITIADTKSYNNTTAFNNYHKQNIVQDIDENEVFKELVKKLHGKATVKRIKRQLSNIFIRMDAQDILLWFKHHTDTKHKFHLFLNTELSEESMIVVFVKQLKLCFAYPNGCRRNRCTHLHLCRQFVLGCCKETEESCRYSHSLWDSHNKEIICKCGIKIKDFNEENIRCLVNCSVLKVCGEYIKRKGKCEGLSNQCCPDLHICDQFIQDKCIVYDEFCKLGHDFMSPQCVQTLEEYQMGSLSKNVIRKIVLVEHISDDIYEKRSAMHVTHIIDTDDNNIVNIPICDANIQGICRYGEQCKFHHYFRPYLWQLSRGSRWTGLDFDAHSVELEKLFCRNIGATRIQLTWKDDKQVPELIHINISSVPMYWVSDDGGRGIIRRLSTKSYVEDDNTAASNLYRKYSTKWVWYWFDNDKVWQEYQMDSPPYQDVLEAKYLQGDNLVYFENVEHQYIIDLKEMTQRNLFYGTVRKIRRRPLFVDKDVNTSMLILQDNCLDPSSSRHYEVEMLPNGWSPMSTITPDVCDRIPLLKNDKRYTRTKAAFFKTMDETQYQIENIYKIQNLSMWEAFSRKKESMGKKCKNNFIQLEEKQLFHGTDNLDTVKCILHQNFDPRMHGKNATVFGKGTYFAVNAKYSNQYAGPGAQKYLFYAHVLIGRTTQGSESLQRPPPIDPSKPHGELYDTCVNDELFPSIFVVFEREQCYPEYLICYKKLDITKPKMKAPVKNLSSGLLKRVASSTVPSQTMVNLNQMPLQPGTIGRTPINSLQAAPLKKVASSTVLSQTTVNVRQTPLQPGTIGRTPINSYEQLAQYLAKQE